MPRHLTRSTYHDIVVCIPGQLLLDDHVGGDERGEQGADRVARVQKALDGVGLVHGADPGAHAGVQKAVAEAANDVDDDKDRVGWVQGQDNIGDDVADGRHDGDTSLAELDVNSGIGEGGDGVASEGRQEDE